jgi:hypothetical protein
MDRIATGPPKDRRDLFSETASRLGMNPAIVEKDFWVCWILKHLFAEPALKGQMVFKGGTSLSKVFGLIDRFSEDIDLILDWRLLGYGHDESNDPYQAIQSKTKQSRYNQEMNAKAAAYIRGTLLGQLSQLFAGVSGVVAGIDGDDPHTVNVFYRVFRPTLKRAATFCRSSPWSISLRAWVICCGVNFGLRPNFTPRRCAAFTPARVRSLMRLRSSSASTPIICYMARPVGVSVSICSVRERNLTPRSLRSSSMAIRSRKLRPRRSSFQTMSVSPSSNALRQRSRAGRLVVAPDKPWSLKNVLHPARFKAASCKAVLWSSVNTRA